MGGRRSQLAESLSAFRAVVRNPGVRRLELAWAASVIGHWAYLVAVSVYAYQVGGESAVGLIFLLRLVPAALIAPFTGLLADRYRRERVLLGSVSARVALIGAAAACVFLDVDSSVVYALAVVAALATTPFRSAQAALTPSLCASPTELTAANAVASTIESVAVFLGPALSGILLAVASTGAVFAVTASMLVVSGFFVLRIPAAEAAPPKHELEASTIASEALAGFRAVGSEPPLRVLIGLLTAQTLIAGAVQVYIVVVSIELLGLGKAGVGYLNSAIGVGSIVGGIVAFGLTGARRLSPAFMIGIVLWGVPLALLGLSSQTAVALLLFGLMGFGNSFVDVAGFTLVQRAVPDDVLARVFGVIQMLWLGSVGVGAVLAPRLISWLGTKHALVATGVFLVGLVAVFAVRLAAIDAAGRSPDPDELRLLGGIPIFAPLGGATLEHLAGRLIPLALEPGTEIVRQGAAGDRFYMIAEGEVEVSADGHELSVHGAGGYFGEIALLRDVPRTATVTARTRVVLYALERDDFLAAVTEYAPSLRAAEGVITARLATSHADAVPSRPAAAGEGGA
jgi:MFS family permease